MSHPQSIILFDGICNLCNTSVQFVIKRDKKEQFQFAALQGEFGQKTLERYTIEASGKAMDSFILLENDQLYTQSTAALRVARRLSGGWKLLYAFIIVPRFIRDGVYKFIARNRYRWFGKKDSCMIPSPALKARFLD